MLTFVGHVCALGRAADPVPADGQQYVGDTQGLTWTANSEATSHDVYFGTDETAVAGATTNSAEFKVNQAGTSYDPGTLNTNWTSYYWRVDEKDGTDTVKGRVWEFSTAPVAGPPYTDYCKMLEHDIVGRKHGFLAGNASYYVGGFYANWFQSEDETIGLTHPFHHDLRSSGHGMVDDSDTGLPRSIPHMLARFPFVQMTSCFES